MNADGGFRIDDILGILRRRAKVAGLVALAVFLVAYWIAMALPNVYRSYATVLVEPQAVAEELVKAGVRDSDLNERLHLMTAQILSRPKLSRVIDDLGLYKEESQYMLREEVIDLMRKRVSVEPVVQELGRSSRRQDLAINEFKILFEDYDVTLAKDVAQRLANDFLEHHIDARVQISQKSLDFIQGELERLAGRIRKIESEVARVKNENAGSLPDDLAANQRRLDRVLQDMALAQRAQSEAQSDEGFYSSQMAAASAYSAPNDDASPVRRLELLKLQLGEYQSKGYTEKHPDIIRTKAEIEALQSSISMDDTANADTGRKSLVAHQVAAEARRAALRRASAESELVRLRELAEDVEAQIAGTPAVAEQLDGLSREYEHLFGSFQDFSNRHLEATVQAQLERRQLGEQFRVLEQAFEAPEPSAPNRPLILILGAFLGLAVGAGIGILIESTDTSAHDARQLQSAFQLPVLAAIPEIWLESDRQRLRRQRLGQAVLTAGLVAFALVGGAANYMWVNGAPGLLSAVLSGEPEAGTEPGASEG